MTMGQSDLGNSLVVVLFPGGCLLRLVNNKTNQDNGEMEKKTDVAKSQGGSLLPWRHLKVLLCSNLLKVKAQISYSFYWEIYHVTTREVRQLEKVGEGLLWPHKLKPLKIWVVFSSGWKKVYQSLLAKLLRLKEMEFEDDDDIPGIFFIPQVRKTQPGFFYCYQWTRSDL